MVTVTKLMDDEAQKIGALALKERRDRDRAFAQQIYPIALNRGTLWHIGSNRDIWERNYIITTASTHDFTDLNKKADLMMIGPITRNFYALDKGSGKISVRDWTTWNWREAHEVKGGAIDLWVMPEPNKAGPAGERLVVVGKNGNMLELSLLPTNAVAKTNIQGNTKKISQFRSIEIGGSNSLHLSWRKGKIYSGQPRDGRLGDALELTEWIDLGDGIHGLAIGKDEQLSANQIIAYSDNKILRRRFAPADKFNYPKDDPIAWKAMNLPSAAKGKKITFAAASASGHVLACLNDNKLWVHMPLTQDKGGGWNWGWKEETKGSMKAVLEEPIQGFDKFSEFWKTPST